jgi:hypothetical protein
MHPDFISHVMGRQCTGSKPMDRILGITLAGKGFCYVTGEIPLVYRMGENNLSVQADILTSLTSAKRNRLAQVFYDQARANGFALEPNHT